MFPPTVPYPAYGKGKRLPLTGADVLFEDKASCGCSSAPAQTMEAAVHAGYNQRWGVTDEAYFLVFGSLHAGLGRLALMPLVVLASRICPKVSCPWSFPYSPCP